MEQVKQLAYDRRGSTLIEIIVSVLIIGIAFVPLMMGLNSSIRVNEETEKQLYAENLASDIIEVCKSYGENKLSSTNLQSIFTGATATKVSDVWTISGLESGDRKYSATIKFNEAPYTDGQNDYSAYPSLSKVDNICTVAVSQADNILKTIVNYYWTKASEGAGHTEVSEDKFKKAYGNWLERTITVNVIKATEADKTNSSWDPYGGISDDDIGKYVIMTTYKFSVNVSAKDADGHGFFGTKSASEVGDYTTSFHSKIVKAKKPSIVLTFSPLNKVEASKNGKTVLTPDKIFKDEIVINRKIDEDLYIYSLCKNGSKSKQELIVSEGTTPVSGKTHFYSNLIDSRVHLAATMEKIAEFGGGGAIQQTKMKDVIVSVKTLDGSDEILKKTSTVIEFE